jgi:hypothetical protein
LQSQIEKRGLHGFELDASFTPLGDDMIMGSSRWLDAEGARHRRTTVLTIRDGMIADMQVCGSRRQARRFARRRQSFGRQDQN